MLLAIDVGNTQTQAGVYSGDELLHEWRISTDRGATADELAADHDQILRLRGGSLGELDEMVVASVVPTLSMAYRSALRLAVEHGLRTMAFPAISTGIYGYPLRLATEVAVNAVRTALDSESSVRQVVFACFSPDVLEEYRRAGIVT